MKNYLKKAFAVLIAAVMLFSISIPAFAAAENKNSKTYPVIFVPGILNSPLYDSNGKTVFWPEFFNDTENVVNLVKKVAKLEESKDYAGVSKTLVPLLHKWFDPAKCTAEGKSVNNLHVKKVYSSFAVDTSLDGICGEFGFAKQVAKKIGAENCYMFTYDWRLDIVDTVNNELRPFVEHVKKETGADKVTLVCSSMGGAVGNTYATLYGDKNDVNKYVFLSSAGNGVTFVNSVITKNIEVIREAIAPYFNASVEQSMGGNGLMASTALSAVSNYVAQIANGLIDSQLEEIWDEILQPIFLSMPGLWELAQGNDKALQKAISENVSNTAFANKLNRYYDIQKGIDGVLKELSSKGVEFAFSSQYDIVGVPLTDKAMVTNTDYLIDTVNTSYGAAVADLFTTLGDDYKQEKDDGHDDHVSPDGVIDASTALFPDNTWFVKGLVHVSYPYKSDAADFVTWLITTGGVDVYTDTEKYPQFLKFTTSDHSLSPLEEIVIEEAAKDGDGKFVSSKITTYTYYTLTFPAWLCLAALAILLIVLIVKKSGNKEEIEGVLTKQELKNLPKAERKAAKKNNKVLIKQYKRDKKSAEKAHKAELKAMPKAERKAAKKADKVQKKANKKQNKANFKARKKQAKLDKKEAKAAKKAGKTPEEVTETKE